jgi:hypothetical protein
MHDLFEIHFVLPLGNKLLDLEFLYYSSKKGKFFLVNK